MYYFLNFLPQFSWPKLSFPQLSHISHNSHNSVIHFTAPHSDQAPAGSWVPHWAGSSLGGYPSSAAQEGLSGARQSLLAPSGERENMFKFPCSNFFIRTPYLEAPRSNPRSGVILFPLGFNMERVSPNQIGIFFKFLNIVTCWIGEKPKFLKDVIKLI